MTRPVAHRRIRRAARVILLDPDGKVLLFRFTAPAYDPFWILPGGECDSGEDYPQAAARELHEETGIAASPAPLGVIRQADYEYLGEPVRSIEHYFHVHTLMTRIDTSSHTAIEREMMREHRWFEAEELPHWPETVYPSDLFDLVSRLRAMA